MQCFDDIPRVKAARRRREPRGEASAYATDGTQAGTQFSGAFFLRNAEPQTDDEAEVEHPVEHRFEAEHGGLMPIYAETVAGCSR